MNNLFGITKGTVLEQKVNEAYKNETNAVGIYYALSIIAKDQGEDETADLLTKLANDEARHAGTYAVINGIVPQDVFAMLKQVVGMENASVEGIKALASEVSNLGFDEASKTIEGIAQDEARHGKVLGDLVENR